MVVGRERPWHLSSAATAQTRTALVIAQANARAWTWECEARQSLIHGVTTARVSAANS